jgi:DNA-binding transcriptional regulator LsrR (DeoR family)
VHGTTKPAANADWDEEVELATRAAWLHFVGALTQSEVAQRLNIAPSKAHRLIARAQKDGLVQVFVEGPSAGCVSLEAALTKRFGLTYCHVAPDLGEEGLPLRTLGRAGAAYLRRTLEGGAHHTIGVGHGRTLAAAVEALPRLSLPELTVVSLLGGLPRQARANPFDVIHRLSERSGAEALIVPVPFFARRAEDRAVLLAQNGVSEAFDRAAQASLHVLGVGDLSETGFLMTSGAVHAQEIAALREASAQGELLGRYFDASGRRVVSPLHDRVIALDPERVRGRAIALIAGGPGKEHAIAAALATALPTALIIDERTARRLITQLDRTNNKANHKGEEHVRNRKGPCP